MKKITLTFILFCACGILAYAGPVSAEKNVTPIAPAPECDWSGFYVGINGGMANFQAKFTDLDYWEGYDTRVLEDTNFTGGGQFGYNWQKGAIVLGVEADADYLNTEVNTHSDFGRPTNSYFQEDHAKIDFMGTVRGRAGVAVQNALIYVTAGVAYAHGDWEERYVEGPGEEVETWTGNDWRWGWTTGVGVEYMWNCHWTVRLETLYTNLQDDTVHPDSSMHFTSDNDHNFRYQFDDEIWTVRLGVNYKFGGFLGH